MPELSPFVAAAAVPADSVAATSVDIEGKMLRLQCCGAESCKRATASHDGRQIGNLRS